MKLLSSRRTTTIADEVWLATALLQKENPGLTDFTVAEIQERVRKEAVTGSVRTGVEVHIRAHCVANRAPSPARHRLLFATSTSTRRLYFEGDPCHPDRARGRSVPNKGDIPERYRHLVDWYRTEFARRPADAQAADPILALRGLGKEMWAGEDPDGYVRRLRKGWG